MNLIQIGRWTLNLDRAEIFEESPAGSITIVFDGGNVTLVGGEAATLRRFLETILLHQRGRALALQCCLCLVALSCLL